MGDVADLEGPPAEAQQALPQYPLRIEGGLLYIEVPLTRLAERRKGITRPGHDACLTPAPTDERSA